MTDTMHAGKTARTPEDCSRMLFAALEAGALDLSVALYEPGAVLFKKSGETMSGHDAIRAGNAELIALKPRFTIEFIRTVISGDGTIATSRAKATLAPVTNAAMQLFRSALAWNSGKLT